MIALHILFKANPYLDLVDLVGLEYQAIQEHH